MVRTAAKKGQRDRRQEILEAASKVITDRGLAETRIQDIAEACGVSAGLILYYFESKDRLLAEALTLANDRFYLETAREMRKISSAPPSERVVGLASCKAFDVGKVCRGLFVVASVVVQSS